MLGHVPQCALAWLHHCWYTYAPKFTVYLKGKQLTAIECQSYADMLN